MSAMEGSELDADSDSCVRVSPHYQHILYIHFFTIYILSANLKRLNSQNYNVVEYVLT